MVDTVKFHLVTNIHRIDNASGTSAKISFISARVFIHSCLDKAYGWGHPNLFPVLKQIKRSCFGILLVYKVNVIGTKPALHYIFGILYQFFISNLLQFIRFVIGTGTVAL